MIIYIGPRRQTYLLRKIEADERRPRWIARTYSWLFRTPRLPAATYIFLGIDRLDMSERRLAGQFYRHINAQGPSFRALNDPSTGMGRYRLLRSLYAAGINQFNAYLATEPLAGLRFPVFIRSATASLPPLSGLIENDADLQGTLAALVAKSHPPEDLLIIEFCAEPLANGLFRKQAEYRLADRYVPNPSIYAENWYVKYSHMTEVPLEAIAYDEAVMHENPFADLARRVFAIASIEYGRIDIGLVGGAPQVYEANFNPDVTSQRQRPNVNPRLRELWTMSDGLVFDAIKAIDQPSGKSAHSLSNNELQAFRLRFWRNYAPQRY